MREAQYQTKLIRKLESLFPGCIVLKNDSSYKPGIPDLIILFSNMWAMLEVKLSGVSYLRPNQNHYIRLLDSMSFASFISPDNEEDVLYDLQCAFGVIRPPRVS
jgi:hypothetical protein